MPTQDMDTIPEILLVSISSVFLAPVLEELTFRYSLSVYKSMCGKMAALFFISVFFGLLHIHNLYTAVSAGIDGVLFGIVFLKTKKLIIPILMHIASNSCTSFFGILYNVGITIRDNPSLMYFNNGWLLVAVLAAVFGIILLKLGRKGTPQGNR